MPRRKHHKIKEIRDELLDGFGYSISKFTSKVDDMDNIPLHIKTDFYGEFDELHAEIYFQMCLEKIMGDFV